MEDRPETEYYLRDEQVEASDASIDEVGALCTEECCSKGPRGKEQRVRRWPRKENSANRNERRKSTSPRNSAQFIYVDGRDE